MFDRSRPLVFMHVPKCGGTSLDLALQKSLGISDVKRFFGTVLHADVSPESYRSWDPKARHHVAINAMFFTEGSDFVVAHASYPELRHRHPDGQFITFLREPVCRLISLRTFLRGFTDEAICNVGTYGISAVRARLSLKAFLEHSYFAAGSDNVVTRMLLHGDPLIPQTDFIDPAHDQELTQKALAMLQRFDFVSALDSPTAMSALSAYLGVEVVLERDNESSTMPHHLRCDLASELDDETMSLLERHSRLDTILWNFAMGITDDAESFRVRTRLIGQCIARHCRLLLPD